MTQFAFSVINKITFYVGILALIIFGSCLAADDKDNLHIKSFEMPRYSAYLGKETRHGIHKMEALYQKIEESCSYNELLKMSDSRSIRACEKMRFKPIIAAARELFDVEIESEIFGGVYADIITPTDGVSDKNEHRVLISLHSGGFKYGARYGGQLGAMPLAAMGKFKVVAIDYRKAPDFRFPAASIDVAVVYQELLNDYRPENIGIYGCSAGARLTGEAIAWFDKEGLPQPGAAAMLCSAPTRLDGDSNYVAFALENRPPLTIADVEYWDGVEPDDPLAFPGESDEMLAKFPPSLLITSSRDYSLSPMSFMHSRMVDLGVETELHIFEGFSHGGFLNMYVPESQ